MTLIFGCTLDRKAELDDVSLGVVPDLEDVGLEIRPAVGNLGFSIGIGITQEQE